MSYLIITNPFENTLPVEVWGQISKFLEDDAPSWMNLCEASEDIDDWIGWKESTVVVHWSLQKVYPFLSKRDILKLRGISKKTYRTMNKLIDEDSMEKLKLCTLGESSYKVGFTLSNKMSTAMASDILRAQSTSPFLLNFTDKRTSRELEVNYWENVEGFLQVCGRNVKSCHFDFCRQSESLPKTEFKVKMLLKCLSHMPQLEKIVLDTMDRSDFARTLGKLANEGLLNKTALEKVKLAHLWQNKNGTPPLYELIHAMENLEGLGISTCLKIDVPLNLPKLRCLMISQFNESMYSNSSLSLIFRTSPLELIDIQIGDYNESSKCRFDISKILICLSHFKDTLSTLSITYHSSNQDPRDPEKYNPRLQQHTMEYIQEINLPNLKVLTLTGYIGPLSFLTVLPSLTTLKMALNLDPLITTYVNESSYAQARQAHLEGREPDMSGFWKLPKLKNVIIFSVRGRRGRGWCRPRSALSSEQKNNNNRPLPYFL